MPKKERNDGRLKKAKKVSRVFKNKAARDRAREKIAILDELDPTDESIRYRRQENGVLRVIVKKGKKTQRLFFQNPPVMVPDGTYRTEIDEITGEEIQVANYRYDPAQALRDIVDQSFTHGIR